MPKFDVSKEVTAVKGWATAHLIIAVAIAFAAGFIFRSLFG